MNYAIYGTGAFLLIVAIAAWAMGRAGDALDITLPDDD
jgi:hypothetical protein